MGRRPTYVPEEIWLGIDHVDYKPHSLVLFKTQPEAIRWAAEDTDGRRFLRVAIPDDARVYQTMMQAVTVEAVDGTE